MVTIVIGSNRKGNISSVIGEKYAVELKKHYDGDVKILKIEEMPSDVLNPDMYATPNVWVEKVKAELIIPADKFIFILPEYNGTFPGSVKLFIDVLSSKDAEKSFYGKKAALVGLSAGKFGNWLGLEHFGVVLNYIKISVFHQKVSISNLWNFMEDGVKFNDPKADEYIGKQLDGFLKF